MRNSWIFLLTLIFISSINVSAQKWDISIAPYNCSDIGWYGQINVGLTTEQDIRFYSGITLHYNHDKMPDLDTGLYLHKRFKALSSIEHIGLNAGIQKNINLFRSDFLTTFISYDLTIRNMGAESYRAVPKFIAYDSVNNQYYQFYKVETTTIKNLWSFENILSAGVAVQMTKRLDFVTTFGAGVNLIFNVPKPISSNSVVAEHSLKTSVGIRYKF